MTFIADINDQTNIDKVMVTRENTFALHDLCGRELDLDLYSGCPGAATARKEEALTVRASL